MKKNRMMRLASVLLVLTLLSTSVISGTFAKYVTELPEETDSARVAKWGVSISATDYALFSESYETDDTAFSATIANSVSSSDKVLAPGTEGTFTGISITGTPEVAVDVAVTASVEVSDNWLDGDVEFYCPVVVTVGDAVFCGLKYDSAGDFADAIAEAIESYSAQYAPGKDLSEITTGTEFDISWEWAFDDDDHVALACDCAAGAQDDTADTKLGEAAVAKDLTIEIGVAITVTQID